MGGEGRDPTADAVGYRMSPLPGLWNCRPHGQDFLSELLTQDTSVAFGKCVCL